MVAHPSARMGRLGLLVSAAIDTYDAVIACEVEGQVTVAAYSQYMRSGSSYGSTIEMWAWAEMLGVHVDVVVADRPTL